MSFWTKEDKESRAGIAQALAREGHDTIKRLGELLAVKPKSRRKVDIVAEILPHLAGEPLRETFERLDETQKKAVAEAIYHPKHEFDDGRFKAKHNLAADFGKARKMSEEPTATLLRLFIFGDEVGKFVPVDLSAELRKFVAPPAKLQIKPQVELPATINLRVADFDWRTRRQTIETRAVPLTIVETEANALRDVAAVLRLVDAGKITASDKTFQPSANAVWEITNVLQRGDFYELPDKKNKNPVYLQEIGAIKGFAWAMLLQAAKLIELSASKKLKVSAEGRKMQANPPHEILRFVWQRWLKSTLLDELRRVDAIKGQTGKGKSTLTGIKPRREAINETLKICPINGWLAVDQFFNIARANFDFSVSRNLWELYVEEHEYGALGYEFGASLDKWLVVEGRYALCVLFEYAATIGLIDVAFIPPAGARHDYKELWGVDDYEFFSRYDGLMYIRLNNLGAYCLGLTDVYDAPQVAVKSRISVLPDLSLRIAGEPLAADERLFLSNFAEPESETVWRLDRGLTIAALEGGQKIEVLREFLQKRDEQELPEIVEAFLRATERRAAALRDKGTTRIIEAETAEIAAEIAAHPQTKKLCFRAGEKLLAVRTESEMQFREAVRKIGYGTKL